MLRGTTHFWQKAHSRLQKQTFSVTGEPVRAYLGSPVRSETPGGVIIHCSAPSRSNRRLSGAERAILFPFIVFSYSIIYCILQYFRGNVKGFLQEIFENLHFFAKKAKKYAAL
jgi:hypothetical protein